MGPKDVTRPVKLRYEDKEVEVVALFDTGASRSVMSEDLAVDLGAVVPLPDSEQYELTPINPTCKARVTAKANVRLELPGCPIPSTTFEVTRDIGRRRLIIGRPELDAWDVEFTPEGPRPSKCPVELELI